MKGVPSKIHPYRTLIILIALLLIAIGYVFFVSSSYNADRDTYKPPPFDQMRWIVLGIIAFLLMQVPSYRNLGRLAFVIYGICIVLLVFTTLFGVVINSSRRWLPIIGSVRIQPSEFMKIGLVLVLAWVLRSRVHNSHSPE